MVLLSRFGYEADCHPDPNARAGTAAIGRFNQACNFLAAKAWQRLNRKQLDLRTSETPRPAGASTITTTKKNTLPCSLKLIKH
jgi:hypothetical protein